MIEEYQTIPQPMAVQIANMFFIKNNCNLENKNYSKFLNRLQNFDKANLRNIVTLGRAIFGRNNKLDVIPKITCPLYFIVGDEDEPRPAKESLEMSKLNKNSIKNRQMTIVGKSLEPRLCFINRDTELAIYEYLSARNDIEPALFISNQNGKRITESNIQRIFQRVCENSNGKFEKVHPHTLRHCFATSMLDRGVAIVYIQDFMGHQSLDTTKIYTHYSNNKLREVYEKANI